MTVAVPNPWATHAMAGHTASSLHVGGACGLADGRNGGGRVMNGGKQAVKGVQIADGILLFLTLRESCYELRCHCTVDCKDSMTGIWLDVILMLHAMFGFERDVSD
jgi:hypothetical protein